MSLWQAILPSVEESLCSGFSDSLWWRSTVLFIYTLRAHWLLGEVCIREMCALGKEEKAKIELCYFVLLTIFPETHRRRGALLLCPSSHIPRDTHRRRAAAVIAEVAAMAFHSSCIYSCDGSRIWTDQVEILERDDIWNSSWGLGGRGTLIPLCRPVFRTNWETDRKGKQNKAFIVDRSWTEGVLGA